MNSTEREQRRRFAAAMCEQLGLDPDRITDLRLSMDDGDGKARAWFSGVVVIEPDDLPTLVELARDAAAGTVVPGQVVNP